MIGGIADWAVRYGVATKHRRQKVSVRLDSQGAEQGYGKPTAPLLLG